MFQRFHKKISSSEKKFKCSLFNNFAKAHARTETSLLTQRLPEAKEECEDTLVVVSRPPPNVRLVLFQELGGDRPVLFDSKRIQKVKVPASKTDPSLPSPYQTSIGDDLEAKPQFEYQYVHCPSDKTELLSEMLFGSVGMAQKAATLKIHYIKNPPAIMLSRVFCLLSSKENAASSLDRGIENQFEALRNSSISSRRKAKTMPVPSIPPTPSASSSHSSHSGGKFYRSDSSISLSSVSSLISNSSRSISGSLGTAVMRIPSSTHGRAQSLPRNQRDSFTLLEEVPNDKLLSAIRKTRMKIGFAVICEPEPKNSAEFQQFFFEHFPLIESHLTSLKENIEKALLIRSKPNFIESMMKALNIFSTKIHSIYSFSRLPEPVWSTLTLSSTRPDHRRTVINSFIGDLARMATEYNTKQKNHFFTGLLTAVLTYHLGWVTSASPVGCCEDCHKVEKPYNALWAQLGDLYGAVGAPTKVCRTIVTGNGHELVSTVLSVLSYFIRSARIDEAVSVPEKITPKTLGLEQSPPLCVSYVPSEIEDSDYVFVSVCGDTEESKDKPSTSFRSNTTEARTKTAVVRSRSSPQNPRKDYTIPALSRSNSGPLIRQNTRSRSNAILEAKPPNIARSCTSNLVSKPQPVQSRRQSRDPVDVAMPTVKTFPCRFSKQNKSGLSDEQLKSPAMFKQLKPEKFSRVAREGTAIQGTTFLPDGSTHFSNSSHLGEENISTSSLEYSSTDKDTNICHVIPSFVDAVRPQVEREVKLYRECTYSKLEEIPLSILTPAPYLKRKTDVGLTPSSSSTSLRNSSVDAIRPDEVEDRNSSPLRSTSNPSLGAKESYSETHARGSSNSRSSKVRLGHRRHHLPNSPINESVRNTPKDSHGKSENPSFKRIKLMRIPSVQMNHNAFEEYFGDDPSEDAISQDIDCNDSTQILEVIDKQEQTKVSSSSHRAQRSSCLNTSTAASYSPRTSAIETVGVTKTPKEPHTVLPLYPTLPKVLPPPVRAVERPTNDLKIKKIYPSLPSKSPVGVVSFNVGNERVSFHHGNITRPSNPAQVPLPQQPPPQTMCPPHRQWSCQSNVTLKPEDHWSDNMCLEELPLADVKEHNSSHDDEDTKEPTTGFTSLMADYNHDYVDDFVLQGVPNQAGMHHEILTGLDHMIRRPVLDEPVAEALCVLADTDSWSVKVYSSQRLHSDRPCLPALVSKLVGGMLSRIAAMAKLKMDPEFCMNDLESELRQLVLKSRMLAEYVRGDRKVTMSQLTAALSIESQDLPLLMAIASCHSPHVAPILL